MVALWPWARKRRRSGRLKPEGSPTAESKKAVGSHSGQTTTLSHGSRHGVNRRISKRNSQRSRRGTAARLWEKKAEDKGSREISPVSPTSPLSPVNEKKFEKRRNSGDSLEDITALPHSKELRTSPHLRPATQDQPDIPYNFRLASPHPHSPTPREIARERGKLQRNPSRNKRATDSPLPMRKSSKKRKDNHIREEEIRAMSAPIIIPKRSSAQDTGILRRDSRKTRGGLNRYMERPTSNISLPLEDSIHSSMSGSVDSLSYEVGTFGVFTPRPTIRYSLSGGQYSSAFSSHWTNPSRTESGNQRAHFSTNKDVLKQGKTVDALADDLDASALRELMERDERRREKRRQSETERLKRKLERKAEKQRAKELKREQEAAAREERSQAAQAKKDVGLGIAAAATSSAQEPTPEPESTPAVPDRSDAEPTIPADEPTPHEDTADEPEISTAQAIRYSQANLSPPTSPVQAHTRGPSNVSEVPELGQISTQQVEQPDRQQPTPVSATESEPTPGGRRSSETSHKRLAGWTSFFRRGSAQKQRKASEDKEKPAPSAATFSNTSRESMGRQVPPAYLQLAPRRTTSGTPVRTMSKFREDLPELPLSPPDSRVQSPEVTASGAAIAARRGSQPPANLQVGLESPGPGESEESATKDRPDSAGSPGARASNLSNMMSQSLGSVDSEGSWLSGKPIKRGSSQMRHARDSAGSGSIAKHTESFSASWEELGLPEDEYFKRLTPQPDDHTHAQRSSDILPAKSSDTAVLPSRGYESEEEELASSPTAQPQEEAKTIVHDGVGRQPTVVHLQTRIKSSEGLLKEFSAAGVETTSSSPVPGSADKETPSEDLDTAETPFDLQRAKSVDLGNHARRVSAGSAVLLEIPARRQSVDPKRGSSSTVGDTGAKASPVEE